MYIFCAGMYRAGSTWQYNVVSHLVEMFGVGRRIGFFNDGKSFSEYSAQNPSRDELLVLKSHDGHPEFAKRLAERNALGVYVYRDLRDVAFSLAHKCHFSFEQVVGQVCFLDQAIHNDEFWRSQPRVLCQKYEEVIDNPIPAILELAKHLDLCISTELAESIADEYSFAANVERARAITAECEARGLDLSDPENTYRHDDRTLLHWNHMREGRPGAWRDEATPKQIVALLAACGDWLIRCGYEPDCSWAWGGQDTSRAELVIRELARSCEAGAKQALGIRRQIVELNAEFHALSEFTSRSIPLESVPLFVVNQISRIWAILARYPRLHALLHPLFVRGR